MAQSRPLAPARMTWTRLAGSMAIKGLQNLCIKQISLEPFVGDSLRPLRRTNGDRRFKSKNFGMQLPRERLSVCDSSSRFGELNESMNGALGQQVDKVRHECHVFPVTDFFAHVAVGKFISYGARC